MTGQENIIYMYVYIYIKFKDIFRVSLYSCSLRDINVEYKTEEGINHSQI